MSTSILRNTFAALLGIALTASVLTGCDVKANLKIGRFDKKDDSEAQEKALTEVERNNGLAAFKRKDYKTAFSHFKAAAERGDAEAQYMLAICCADGKGVERDVEQSLEWVLQSAEQGFAKAQFVAGMNYLGGGDGIPKDIEKAKEWIEKSIDGLREAAENGDPEAQSYLGILYIDGAVGVEKDKKKALELLHKAGEQGYADAQFALAMLSMQEKKLDEAVEDTEAQEKALTEVERNNGLAAFKRKDYKTAFSHFKAAAERGDAEAQYMLAICCADGKGVERDVEQSLEWALQSAEQDFAKAQFVAGMNYLGGGDGIPKDIEKAKEWIEKSIDGLREAADNGDPEAQSYLGILYIDGAVGVEKDKKKALELLHKAGEQGYADAQFAIAMLSMQDNKLDEAVDWFRKAAENDSSEAMLFLGRIYENGMNNIKPDKAEAEKWYKKAATDTNPDIVKEAKSSLNRLKKKK